MTNDDEIVNASTIVSDKNLVKSPPLNRENINYPR